MIEEKNFSVEVKFVDIRKNTNCEGSFLDITDTEERHTWQRMNHPRSPCRKRCVLDVEFIFNVAETDKHTAWGVRPQG